MILYEMQPREGKGGQREDMIRTLPIIVFVALIATPLAALVATPANADELILDRSGRTVLIVKPSPYSDSQRVVRDRQGRTKYIIKPSGYPGGGSLITDKRGRTVARGVDSWLWDEGDGD